MAEAAKRPFIRRFKQQIDDARSGRIEDPILKNALALAEARNAAEHPSDREVIDDEIAHLASTIAGKPIDEVIDSTGDRHPRYDPQREKQATEFAGIATGAIVPLEAHYPAYFAQLKTKVRTRADDKRAIAYLEKWCDHHSVPKTLQAITKRRAVTFIDDLPGLAREIGPVTVRKYLNRLSQYWKWLEAREHVTVNVWREITIAIPTVMDHEKERALTDDEMLKLLHGPASRALHDLMRIAALSGARLDAIVCLSVGDCADGVFRFKPQKKETGFRLVHIHSALREIIERRTAGKGPTHHLFPEWPPVKKADSERERSFAASKAFATYRKSVGVDVVVAGHRRALTNFHSFRRWFITKAERAHQPESIIASVVGHKRKGMTLGTYSAGPSGAQFRKCVESVKLPIAKVAAASKTA